jgi:hypothetical protein
VYENPDGFLMADHEKRQVPPVTLPVQDRHVVYPPADPDKLAWCLATIKRIGQMITREQMVRDIHAFDSLLITIDLRERLGDPLDGGFLWIALRSDFHKQHCHPIKGTWDRALELDRERERFNVLAAPITVRIEALKTKRITYRSMEHELESNIKPWEGL